MQVLRAEKLLEPLSHQNTAHPGGRGAGQQGRGPAASKRRSATSVKLRAPELGATRGFWSLIPAETGRPWRSGNGVAAYFGLEAKC